MSTAQDTQWQQWRRVRGARPGSWESKHPYDRWKILEKQLRDAQRTIGRTQETMISGSDVCLEDGTPVFEGWLVNRAVNDLEEVLECAQEALTAIHAHYGTTRRIKALRNTEGRTPEEASVYLAKADELEASS